MKTQVPLALVTGGNRGIGFEVSRQLARLGHTVILTSRDPEKGSQAAERLRREKLNIVFHQLDVGDRDSVLALCEFVGKEFGKLDVLVNNAAILVDEHVSVFDVTENDFRETMEANFYGAFRMCRIFVPMMKANGFGRIVNVSSGYGAMNEMGGRTAAYRISKTALNALTQIVADEVDAKKIKVNAVCPGWVRTGMGGRGASRSPEKGAETIVWLATLPSGGPSGGFFRDKRSIPW